MTSPTEPPSTLPSAALAAAWVGTGTGTALLTAHGGVLVDGPSDTDSTQVALSPFAGASFADALDRLDGLGLMAPPGVAYLVLTDARPWIAVRGTVQAMVREADGATAFHAGQGGGWSCVEVNSDVTVILALPSGRAPDAAPSQPHQGGYVIGAESLTMRVAPVPPSAPPAEVQPVAVDPTPPVELDATHLFEATLDRQALDDPPAILAPADPGAPPAVAPEPAPVRPLPEPLVPPPPTPVAVPVGLPPPAPEPTESAGPPTLLPGSVFGDLDSDLDLISSVPGMEPPPAPTPVVTPSPALPPWRIGPPPGPSPVGAVAPGAPATTPPPSPPPVPPPRSLPPPPGPSPTPGGPVAAPAVTPEPASWVVPDLDRTHPQEDEGLDDVTVSLAARRAAADAAKAAEALPRVQAVLCPTGHSNPLHAERCRTCDALIHDRTVHVVPRPSLGRLRFDDGTEAELDRHLVIGRKPVPDPLVGDGPHELIRVADPDEVVSRTHAVVRIEGWHVHVIDRDSTNNTFVEIPGRPPFQLRAGEPYPILPGTTVRLGDEVGFTYDPSQR